MAGPLAAEVVEFIAGQHTFMKLTGVGRAISYVDFGQLSIGHPTTNWHACYLYRSCMSLSLLIIQSLKRARGGKCSQNEPSLLSTVWSGVLQEHLSYQHFKLTTNFPLHFPSV